MVSKDSVNVKAEELNLVIVYSNLKDVRAHCYCASPVRTLYHSRPQRPRSFWSAPRIATSDRVQQRKSAIHGLPVTLRMLWVKSGKSDWFWSQSIEFTNPFKTGISLDLARGRDSWCWPKGAPPLGTRMHAIHYVARATSCISGACTESKLNKI